MKSFKKWTALFMGIMMCLFSVAAMAGTIAPDDSDYDDLNGVTVSATVGAYDEVNKVFEVRMYSDDLFEIEEMEKIAVGDKLIAGGHVFTVAGKQADEYGDLLVKCEDGTEILFTQAGDDKMIASIPDSDDRRFMHVFAVMYLPVADGVIFEDYSNPESETPVVYTGLDELLKVKAEKEETSIGLDYYATVITLNDNLEIERINQQFDVAQ